MQKNREHPISPDEAAVSGPAPVLCVDLDGTLVRTDTLVESLVASFFDWRMWRALAAMPFSGRAAMKRRITEITAIDAAALPYNRELVDFLRVEKASGRTLVLATAADHRIASAVSEHLGLFDEVIASDGNLNLKASRKAEALAGRFGHKGFVYAGNSHSDIPVWRAAKAAIVVNAPRAVAGKAEELTMVEKIVDDRPPVWASLVKALRPYQWIKNLLVFVPMVTAHAVSESESWRRAAGAFAAFCLIASAIYIVNDITDMRADRMHPRKSKRPFASGALSPLIGIGAAAVMAAMGSVLAFAYGVLPVLMFYAAVSLSYSLWFKEFPLLDVFVLACLYTVRLFAGGEATGHFVSLWLLGFSVFFFLSLALVKRVCELIQTSGTNNRSLARRGYTIADIAFLQSAGIASGFAATVVLALYVQTETAMVRYASPVLLWCIVPLALFWICRIWLSTARGYMHDDPIVYAAKDWVSWLVSAAIVAAVIGSQTLSFFPQLNIEGVR